MARKANEIERRIVYTLTFIRQARERAKAYTFIAMLAYIRIRLTKTTMFYTCKRSAARCLRSSRVANHLESLSLYFFSHSHGLTIMLFLRPTLLRVCFRDTRSERNVFLGYWKCD